MLGLLGVAKLRAQFGLEDDLKYDTAVLSALDKVRGESMFAPPFFFSIRRATGAPALPSSVTGSSFSIAALPLQVEKSTGALLFSNEAGLEVLRKELQQVELGLEYWPGWRCAFSRRGGMWAPDVIPPVP